MMFLCKTAGLHHSAEKKEVCSYGYDTQMSDIQQKHTIIYSAEQQKQRHRNWKQALAGLTLDAGDLH